MIPLATYTATNAVQMIEKKGADSASYGCANSPFGVVWLVWTSESSISEMFFGENWTPKPHYENRNDVIAQKLSNQIFSPSENKHWNLQVSGTSFQCDVWRALLQIPYGSTVTYSELAKNLGRPKAVRALANAVGANSIAWLIPCHRVIRSDGSLGGYRWGMARKQAMLAWEKNAV